MYKNIRIVVGITILFLGLAIQPSVATVQPKDNDVEYVEIITEVCGLSWVKLQTKKLLREQAEKVDILFDSVDKRLDKIETMEEAKEILNNAIIELDKYDLLGGLSIKQAQRLVTGGVQDSRIMRLFYKIHRNHPSTNQIDNLFCSIVGHNISECWFIRPIHRIINVYDPFSFVLQSIILLAEFYTPAIFSDITFGGGGNWFEGGFEEFPSNGLINTVGLFGKQSYNGSFYGNIKPVQGFGGNAMMTYWEYYVGVTGFTGFRIQKYINMTAPLYYNFLGFAFRVKIGSKPIMD
jgi:hypothetical protein